MPLNDVIAAATSQAAQMLGQGWVDRIGTLGVGRGADIAILVSIRACFSRPSAEGLTYDSVQRPGVGRCGR